LVENVSRWRTGMELIHGKSTEGSESGKMAAEIQFAEMYFV